MDFREAKLQQLDAATTFRVYGHELEFKNGSGSRGASAKLRWRLIVPCFCVQDSPESPCRCMHGDDAFWWWLVGDAVVREGKSGRKDDDGKELQFFDVLVDSQILMESLQPVSVGALKRLGDTISAHRVRGLAADSGPGVPQSIAEIIPWDQIVQFVKDHLPPELLQALDELGKPIHWPPKPA